MIAFTSALQSTVKFRDGFDTVYRFIQDINVIIENGHNNQGYTKFDIVLRRQDEKFVIGQLRNFDIKNGNFSADEALLKDLESPFRIELSGDGLPLYLWSKKDEGAYSLKTKDSVLKLLFPNNTETEQYLSSGKDSIRDEKCQEVTFSRNTDTEYIFEKETKFLDCNGKVSLQGVASDKTEFRVFYHLDKSDKKLLKAKSVVNVFYLTSVAARFETIQNLEFVNFDGLIKDINVSTLTQSHTSEEIDELWKTTTIV